MSTHVSVNVTLPSDREIMLTRLFDAPLDLVYDCYTKMELLKHWMLPDGWTFVTCDNDLTIGGAFHWQWRNAQGQDMGIHGIYREIVPLQRIVRTEIFDQDPTQSVSLGTLLLSEQHDRTTLKITVLYLSRDARDHALKAGVEKGVANAKLDALLAELKRTQSSAA